MATTLISPRGISPFPTEFGHPEIAEDSPPASALLVLPDGSVELVDFPDTWPAHADSRSPLAPTADAVVKEHPGSSLYHDSAWTHLVGPTEALAPGATYYVSAPQMVRQHSSAAEDAARRLLKPKDDLSCPLRLRPAVARRLSVADLGFGDGTFSPADVGSPDVASPATPSSPAGCRTRTGLRPAYDESDVEDGAMDLPEWMVRRQMHRERESGARSRLQEQRLDDAWAEVGEVDIGKAHVSAPRLQDMESSNLQKAHAYLMSPPSPLSRMPTGSSFSSATSAVSSTEMARELSPSSAIKCWQIETSSPAPMGGPSGSTGWAVAMAQFQGAPMRTGGKPAPLRRLGSMECTGDAHAPGLSPQPPVTSVHSMPRGKWNESQVELLAAGLSLGLDLGQSRNKSPRTPTASAVDAADLRPVAQGSMPYPNVMPVQCSLPGWAMKSEMESWDEWADSPPTSDLEDVLEFARSRRDRRRSLHESNINRVASALAESDLTDKNPLSSVKGEEGSKGVSKTERMRRVSSYNGSFSLVDSEAPAVASESSGRIHRSHTAGKSAAGVPLPPSRVRRTFSSVDKCQQEKTHGRKASASSGVLGRLHVGGLGRRSQRPGKVPTVVSATEEQMPGGLDGINLPTCLDLDVICKEGSIFAEA